MELPTYGTGECRHCGGSYAKLTTVQVFCSQRCKGRAKYASRKRRGKLRVEPLRLSLRMCEACDDWFRPERRTQFACSSHCARVARWGRSARIRECEACGKLTLGNWPARFCSTRCYSVAHRAPPSAESLVYFIQGSRGGPIKIGVARDPEKRLKLLQPGNPDKLVLLATRSGGFPVEAQLHRRFAAYRLESEWFDPHPELLALIDDRPQLRLVA